MIRISDSPIRISTMTTDRWGRPVKYWSVNPWGYVGLEQLSSLIYFESQPTQSELLVQSLGSTTGGLAEAIEHRMKTLKAYSTVYQFNCVKCVRPFEYIRMCAILNNEDQVNRIQAIGWFDAHIKYHVYRLICWTVNKLLAIKPFGSGLLND